MKQTQVILHETLQGVGKLGETVGVAAGYARNFLLPRGKAMLATKRNIEAFEAQRADKEAVMAAAKGEAEKRSEKLEKVTVKLQRQASEVGMLYGSVKARDIAANLAEQGHTIERQAIMIGTPIKEVGEHSVKVALHPEVHVDLAVEVQRQVVLS